MLATESGLLTLCAQHDRLSPLQLQAVDEEVALAVRFKAEKPKTHAAQEAFAESIGLRAATAKTRALQQQIWPVVESIYNAVPETLPGLAEQARVFRDRNGRAPDGSTIGISDEIDFAWRIEHVAALAAQAEAADAALVGLVARYEALCGDQDEGLCREPPEPESTEVEAEIAGLVDAVSRACPTTLRGLAALVNAAGQRGDPVLCRAASAHAERLAAPRPSPAFLEPDAAAVGCTDLAGIAREADGVYRRALDLDAGAARLSAQGKTTAASAMRAESEATYSLIESIFDRGLETPAASFADVLAGLVGIAQEVARLTDYIDDEKTFRRLDALGEKIRRRAFALRGFVERFAGVASDRLCGEWCLPSAEDPFTTVETARLPHAGGEGAGEAA